MNNQLRTNIKYNFTKNRDPEMYYKPKKTEYTYYQICSFQNPAVDNLYGVRRIKINEYHEIIDIKEKYYNKKKINKFISQMPINKYRSYGTYLLDNIELPNSDQIISANSELLK